jgi:hypothetical protein
MGTEAKKVNPRSEGPGPGKTVLMPDIYAEENAVEDSASELVDALAPDIEESSGFNPYDTAVLYKK